MSSRSYRGRHAGRHRAGAVPRLPRAFSAGFILPTTAAAALVVTATGATVSASAGPPQDTLALTGQQTQTALAEEAANRTTTVEIATRRQDASMQSAALQGRAEAQRRAARAARAAVRKAEDQAKAQATARAKAKVEAEKRAKTWVRPINSWNVTSGFGWRWGKRHDGIDLSAPTGTPLYAMSSGRVIKAGWEDSFGNKVEIQYWDGSISWYAHMSRIDVQAGQTVVAGREVGLVGNTGHSFGSHLHLEFQRTTTSDTPIDPVPWLKNHGLW